MAQTYASICSTLPYLPPFTRQVLAQINANFDSNFTGVQDSLGYPTNDCIVILVPFFISTYVGPVAYLQLDTYIVVKYLLDECRIALGLPVVRTVAIR